MDKCPRSRPSTSFRCGISSALLSNVAAELCIRFCRLLRRRWTLVLLCLLLLPFSILQRREDPVGRRRTPTSLQDLNEMAPID